jgi:hypothetical protein
MAGRLLKNHLENKTPFLATPKIVAFLLVLSVCIKIILSLYLYPGITPGEIQFVFGGYIQSIVDGLGYVQNCNGEHCGHSMRMPLLPYYLALCFYLGQNWLIVAIKSVLLTFLIFLAWRELRKGYHHSRFCLPDLALVFTILNPLSLKHASTPHYEEFLLTEMMILCGLLWALALKDAKYIGYIVLLSVAAYLTKVNFMPSYVAAMLAALMTLPERKRDRALPIFVIVSSLCLPLGWAMHNHAYGRFTFSTSYAGENLYRATHPQARILYPEVMFDRLLDSDSICIDEKPIPVLNKYPPADNQFSGEWAWNDYYYDLAIKNLVKFPIDNAIFMAEKVWYISVGIIPLTQSSANCKNSEYPEKVQNIYTTFFFVYRCIFLVSCYAIFKHTKKHQRWRLFFSVYLGALCMPLLIGWAWERHMEPIMNFIIACASGIAYQTGKSNRNPVVSG